MLIAFAVSGCTSQPAIQTTTSSKALVEVGWEASCIEYEIQNENGEKIDVSAEVQEALKCFSGSVKLSPDENLLVYKFKNALKLYNFNKNNIETLMPLDSDLEGISCVWSNSGTRIACALLNQQKYEGGTKFVVIDLQDGVLKNIEEYPISADKMADFVCGASCYPGSFWFENEDLIIYEGHNVTAPGKLFNIEIRKQSK